MKRISILTKLKQKGTTSRFMDSKMQHVDFQESKTTETCENYG